LRRPPLPIRNDLQVWRRHAHLFDLRPSVLILLAPAIVVILVDGQLRAAQAFEHQTDALRWAEEHRLINAEAAR
jgi:hypothetical protein